MSTKTTGLKPFVTPVNPKDYERFAIIFLIAGFLLTLYFVINQITYRKDQRSIIKEGIVSVAASATLAIGTLFILLTVGIYL